jgi:hypothetical protein
MDPSGRRLRPLGAITRRSATQLSSRRAYASVMARYRSCPAATRARHDAPRARRAQLGDRLGITGIPNLSLDGLAVCVNTPGGEVHADCRLGLEVKLVSREPRQEIRFADARVADHDDCTTKAMTWKDRWGGLPIHGRGRRAFEQIIVLVVLRHCRAPLGTYEQCCTYYEH